MTTIGAYEAKTHLSELLERASAGEEFIIAKHGRALARLGPAGGQRPPALGVIDAIIDARRGIELGGDLRALIEEGRA
ncbi:type II toxin-antitoxin system Phd/YefM family antitoxin [Humibacter albus]|uniref:type II toxin-antitoxin system Phd/YefM family antitoxin n=1 Tax=Humibacter albus TaxID=427754 RepID=UPI0003B34CC7|nr:type II toxin-antitoxin system prevent-host-death family antitoxin [Humibacter albus]